MDAIGSLENMANINRGEAKPNQRTNLCAQARKRLARPRLHISPAVDHDLFTHEDFGPNQL